MRSSPRSVSTERRTAASLLAALVFLAGLGCDAGFSQSATRLEIRTLSTRADLVSGGDVLVELKATPGTELSNVVLTLNGRDVTGQLKGESKTSLRGLIGGLIVGDNTLTATVKSSGKSPDAQPSILTIRNHPITGPILSGPHLTPYECRTVESGMGPPLDASCSAAQKVDFFYRTSDGTFKPLLDPNGRRPTDMVKTTTNDGITVPYIVRVDSGTINRTIYRIAILDDPKPGTTLSAWRPGAGWNRKLAVSFGGGAGTQYNQGTNQVTAALNHLYLSRGFAHMISTELVNMLHGNAVLQGETLMMLKEYFNERYGIPKWTVGSGGSGGAIQQLLIAQIYPGLLDGLQPSASYPDSTMNTPDCGLFQNFWRRADSATWTDEKMAAVEGYSKGTCAAWERSFVAVYNATNSRGCAMNDASKLYNPKDNPTGARCTVQDMRVNIYGRNPASGFGRKPQDNVGLQYGLAALNSGAISVDEFLNLNERIGGHDIDGNLIPKRSVGDPIAIRAAYESGLLNSGGGGLASVPILHFRSYTDARGDIHDRQRDLTIRARLDKANGRSDNQVIWVGPPRARNQPGVVDLASLSLDAMNRWLDNIAADPAPLSTDKVVRNKPAEAVDTYWDEAGKKFVEKATLGGSGGFNTTYPLHSEPRLVAGAPLTNDVLKCHLKPINFGDYKVTFSQEQRARMSAIFPSGVCDFTRPGIEQVPLKGTYQQY